MLIPMKNYPKLLAKSPENFDNIKHDETLLGHTERVLSAALTIIERLENHCINLISAEFKQLALFGALFHDLGKATNIFQGMLYKDDDFLVKVHPVRHEILSALLITKIDTPLREWIQKILESCQSKVLMMLSWIIGGHHLKLHKDPASPGNETSRLVRFQGTPKKFTFYGSHPDVTRLLKMASIIKKQQINVPTLIDIDIPQEDELENQNLRILVEEYVNDSIKLSKKLTEKEKISLAIAKTIVISADVAGSALINAGISHSEWIKQVLNQTLNEKDLEPVILEKIGKKPLRDFQKKVSESKTSVTITIAGCGTGKTVAAYAWAKNHALGRKLFFCYPTTGTASAGFEDYLLAQSHLERALLHSRAQVDLERMLGTGDQDAWEENQRLEALKAWPQKVIACTVDTVLGLIQNQRRSLFSFPALASGAFIFDEIHQYDAKMFGALIRFLQTFSNSPTLLMSASVPNYRLKLLQESLRERLGQIVRGDAYLESIKRYSITWYPEPGNCWPDVQKAIQDGKKVLWVCNTVSDAVAIYEQSYEKKLRVTPLLYHSRFRYKDRVKLQEKVIQQFRQEGPTLVISTQVCELSLDISADLMVTALAPFPALIQRLGRLNRFADENEPPAPCLVYDFSCHENRPYRREDLTRAKEALQRVLHTPLSQRQLAEVLEEIQAAEEVKTYSAWLDGVWESDQRPLREADASITIILEQDLPEILSYLEKRKLKPNAYSLAPWTIPMYFHPEFKVSDRLGGYPVAAAEIIEYDPVRGARWRKRNWEIL